MTKITKAHKDQQDVGASRAAKIILSGLDRQLVQPAAILVRISGWVLVVWVLYMSFFETFSPAERQNVYLWVYSYIAYMISLEMVRRYLKRIYDVSWYRGIRVLINLLMVSILVSIAPSERHLLILAYAVPIIATIVYFGSNVSTRAGVLILALLGIYLGARAYATEPQLQPIQFLIYSILLTTITIGFDVLRIRTNLVPTRLTEIVKNFYKTLDLQPLMVDILSNAVDITFAECGLIIIINPRTKSYVGHYLYNFELKPYRSIESLARKCFVLVHGKPFDNPDIVAAFNHKTVYDEFFETQPRSVMAEPLYNRNGQVIGVLNLAHNDPNRFNRISKSLLKEFAFLVGNAIENCLEHRTVILREARSREAGEKFVAAATEDEAINVLFEEVRRQIPHAEKLTLHQYTPRDSGLLPIHSYSLDTTPNLYLWSSQKPKKLKADLRMGYGIAGHALELKDTILVPDVTRHPWYVELDHAKGIKSLLVAPLYTPQGNEVYGTISLESSKPSAFNLDDESILTYLTSQTSRSIAKVRGFQAWREQGGTLRKILEQIQAFDLSASEDEILQQITDAAVDLLGFKIARIRILDDRGHLLTKAMSGVSRERRLKLFETDLLYDDLKPFLIESYRVEHSYLIKHGNRGWDNFVRKNFYVPPHKMNDQAGWHAYDALITPLVDSFGDTLGILTLDLPVNGSEPNQQLLESIGVFASSAGWMIELSRFQKRLKDQQLRTQSFIDTISQELAKGRDLSTICEVVVQVGAKLLSSEGCALHLVRGQYIELTHSNYLGADYISRRKPISDRAKSGLTAWVAATGKDLCFNNEEYKNHEAWAADDQHIQLLPSKICRSVLLAPIKDSDGKVIGVITLENKKTITGPKDFDDQDKERLVSLANEFAKALEMIGLYNDMREWERLGLADDLHDLINWYHSGVVMWIEALGVWLEQGDITKAKDLMPDLRKHALTTIFELKELHTNLLKSSLEADNFKEAIRQTIIAWSSRVTPKYKGNLQIDLQCPENIEIPPGLKTTIVRITSLAFSNALQHSGIIENPDIKISVEVQHRDNEVTLSVIDDGQGIDFEKTPEGFGMVRMRELTDKINNWGTAKAYLHVETEINCGTKVLLTLKLSDDNFKN